MTLQEQRARSLLKRLDKVNWDMDLIESEGLPELDEEDNIEDIARVEGVNIKENSDDLETN